MAQAYDVLVVGGGPVGGGTAKALAEGGARVGLVEEHQEPGKPVQCAGLFTPRIFDLVDFSVDDVYLNAIRGAHVWSPGGKMVELDGGKTMAVAIDRAGFDRRCVEGAARAGADVRLGTRATGMRVTSEGVAVDLKTREGTETVHAKVVVGADGVQGRVAKWAKLPRAKELIPCYGSQMAGIRTDTPTHVEMFLGQEQAPGFFSWIIPTDEQGTTGKVEVGIGPRSPLPAQHYWERMFKDPISARFLPDTKPDYDICACIPLGPIKKTSTERVAIVGDAAAQAKPTSGGGVYTGLKCAGHLADVLLEAIEADDFSAKRLGEYDKRWMGELGFELKVGNRLRKAIMFLSDEHFEELFRILKEKEVIDIVNATGDIDYPSRVARKLLVKAPHFFRFSGPVVKSLFAN